MPLVLPESSSAGPAELGGKGLALARLGDGGFNVPAWFAVAPAFYRDGQADPAAIRRFAFEAEQLAAIGRALSAIGGERFAVRSSAVDEDGGGDSFAGQLESYLDVPAREVPEKIREVWLSAFTERVAVYRRERGIDPPSSVPAVLVQRMIEPDSAGVAFSVDPVDCRWSIARVEAVEGSGEKLVSGAADSEGWSVDRDGRATRREQGPEAPLLDAGQAAAIAALARACERRFGRPQDIEWALRSGELFLLQSRPVTTLARRPDPDGVFTIWDNSNIAESYGGVTTPLTFSFARTIYCEVYQQFCRILHVPDAVIADNRPVFDTMLGLVRGRVYYNLISWYRMLALLPGFTVNRRFMEQMMGVKEGLPEAVLASLEKERLGSRVRDGGRLLWALAGLLLAQFRLPGMIRRFHKDFEEALDSLPGPVEDLRADQLTAHFHELEQRLLTRWNAPLVNDFFAMIFFGVLRSLTARWCDDGDGTLQNGLLCGTGTIISAEPARRIQSMARLAAGDAGLTTVLLDGERSAIESAIAERDGFRHEYEDYLERFADRCLNELKLESATLRENPLPLLRSVGNLARRIRDGHSVAGNAEKELQARSESLLRKRLRGRPLRRLAMRLVLGQARRRVRDRENLRFERTRLFGRIRAIFVECGKRLHAYGVLDDPRDVFHLEIGEVVGYFEGTASTTDLMGLVAVRREEYKRFAGEPAPADRFETRGIVNIGNAFEATAGSQPEAAGKTDTLKGIGCCPGRVRGRARVVRDPAGARLEPGEILVAEQTDPGWITLFPAAAGVLVERGSLLSHSAIVARELGIPAVVSVTGLMANLRTGDLLDFDGQTGSIRKLEPEADE